MPPFQRRASGLWAPTSPDFYIPEYWDGDKILAPLPGDIISGPLSEKVAKELEGPPGKDGKDGAEGKEGPEGKEGKEGKEGPEGPSGGGGKQEGFELFELPLFTELATTLDQLIEFAASPSLIVLISVCWKAPNFSLNSAFYGGESLQGPEPVGFFKYGNTCQIDWWITNSTTTKQWGGEKNVSLVRTTNKIKRYSHAVAGLWFPGATNGERTKVGESVQKKSKEQFCEVIVPEFCPFAIGMCVNENAGESPTARSDTPLWGISQPPEGPGEANNASGFDIQILFNPKPGNHKFTWTFENEKFHTCRAFAPGYR